MLTSKSPPEKILKEKKCITQSKTNKDVILDNANLIPVKRVMNKSEGADVIE